MPNSTPICELKQQASAHCISRTSPLGLRCSPMLALGKRLAVLGLSVVAPQQAEQLCSSITGPNKVRTLQHRSNSYINQKSLKFSQRLSKTSVAFMIRGALFCGRRSPHTTTTTQTNRTTTKTRRPPGDPKKPPRDHQATIKKPPRRPLRDHQRTTKRSAHHRGHTAKRLPPSTPLRLHVPI